MLKPRFGAPPKTIALPFWSTSSASPLTLPSTAATPGTARTLASSDSLDRRRERALALGDVERRLAADDDGRALADVGEDRVERLVDRVGEDERAADHRDAEHDRDRRQRRAELAAEQARERDLDHALARPIAARISTAGLRGSSSTITPSARKSMRSAIVGGVRVVRDHDHRLAELLRRARAAARGSRCPSSSRGCRSARRRTRPSASRRARARSRRAAAGRRRARTAGACAGRRGRRAASRSSKNAGSGFSPAIESGSTMFSSAVSIGSRLKNWKTKPMCSRRSSVTLAVGERARPPGRRS